jgi:integrase
MGTIQRRTRKDGTVAYTASIRLKRDGKLVLSLSETFSREPAARAWISKKEEEASKPGGLDRLAKTQALSCLGLSSAPTLADAIKLYNETNNKIVGRTKTQVLRTISESDLAQLPCHMVTSERLVQFAELLGSDKQPQTVMNYMSHLQAVFAVAKPAWGLDLNPQAMRDALMVCKRLSLTSKSNQRERRPTTEEIQNLVEFFHDKWKRGRSLPMHKVVVFALFSTRRQEEIIRIRWDDLETDRVLVRDMKHPGDKQGNNVWVELVPEARRVIDTMPKTKPEIFPYSTDAVSAAFTRACKYLNITGLHFHDLRHEGVSRLFEMGKTIPQAASVSGHKSWQSLQRYSHMRATGDKWKDWSGWKLIY